MKIRTDFVTNSSSSSFIQFSFSSQELSNILEKYEDYLDDCPNLTSEGLFVEEDGYCGGMPTVPTKESEEMESLIDFLRNAEFEDCGEEWTEELLAELKENSDVILADQTKQVHIAYGTGNWGEHVDCGGLAKWLKKKHPDKVSQALGKPVDAITDNEWHRFAVEQVEQGLADSCDGGEYMNGKYYDGEEPFHWNHE